MKIRDPIFIVIFEGRCWFRSLVSPLENHGLGKGFVDCRLGISGHCACVVGCNAIKRREQKEEERRLDKTPQRLDSIDPEEKNFD